MEENIKKEGENNGNGDKTLYQCKECGFHYADKETAEKCEKWCKEHKTCNVEITKNAKENKNIKSEPKPEQEPSLMGENGISNSLELEMCGKQRDEYLNNWKRERADFLNYKKDEMERFASFAGYAKEKIILEILPILDNLELATRQNFPSENLSGQENNYLKNFYEGVLQIKKQIKEFLKKEGIEEIETFGKPFDPNFMEIISEIPNSQFPISNTVTEELQKGYVMNGKVLRPAKVKISK